MDIAEMIHNIETAGEGDIQEIVFAAMERDRELYPDWEIVQYSLYKKRPKRIPPPGNSNCKNDSATRAVLLRRRR